MKRLFTGLMLLICLIFGASGTPKLSAASTQDFTISSYDIVYSLSRDKDNVAQLKTTETIVAQFPDYDQNHGIERAIPASYDGHSTDLTIDKVEDADGTDLTYTTYQTNGNTVLRIGDADTYVHGPQTYVISYSQEYVTKHYDDTNADEFYWDTNGTEWQVPIDQLTITATIEDDLLTAFTEASCYEGSEGASTACAIAQTDNVFRVEATSLAPGENVTIALGFSPDTFAVYSPTLFERLISIFNVSQYVSWPVAIIITLTMLSRWRRVADRQSEVGTVVAEYLPPETISITTAAHIVSQNSSNNVFAAQLIDLAVRGYLKIYQTQEKSFWKPAEYNITITNDVTSLRDEEREILRDIYGHEPAVNEILELKTLKNNSRVADSITDNYSKLQRLVRGEYALRERQPARRRQFTIAGFTMLVLGVLTLSPGFLVSAVFSFILGYLLWPLSERGLALRRQLLGLKLYIAAAEVDRLGMLQSAEGAQKIGPINVNDPSQMVKLYEKVLPYAIIFGQEKSWNSALGRYYESLQASPDWLTSTTPTTVFNAAVLGSVLSSFTSSISYAAPSNSSRGGSSGGGSSGGGGGGGGGGGW